MSILITRLITSEEILGDVEFSEDGSTCTITNPTLIAAMRNPQTGNVDVHMGPFNPLSSSKSITLNASAILCHYEPVTDVLNKYNTMFGSGLILPKNTGLSI